MKKVVEEKNLKKGVIFSIFSLILVALTPIIILTRPMALDFYIFTAMSCLIQAIIFLPMFFIERRQIKSVIQMDNKNSESRKMSLNGWKTHIKFLVYLGVTFALAQLLFFFAFEIAGAINGSLATRVSIIFALIFGFLLNHEKISKVQVLFSVVLLFGLFLAITQGNFNLLEFNLGIMLIILSTLLLILAHTLTKPLLDKKELTPIQAVFLRSLLSGLLLISTYFLFFPLENIILLFSLEYYVFFIIIGVTDAFSLYFWYKSLSYIDVSIATIILAFAPILTAIFAFLFLDGIFTVFHLIGMIIIIFSIYMIIKGKRIATNEEV